MEKTEVEEKEKKKTKTETKIDLYFDINNDIKIKTKIESKEDIKRESKTRVETKTETKAKTETKENDIIKILEFLSGEENKNTFEKGEKYTLLVNPNNPREFVIEGNEDELIAYSKVLPIGSGMITILLIVMYCAISRKHRKNNLAANREIKENNEDNEIIKDVEEGLEASYPSSHTLLAVCICMSTIMLVREFMEDALLRRFTITCSFLLMVFIVVTRILSGVHWATDIIGGLFISAFLLSFLKSMICAINAGREKRERAKAKGKRER